MFDDYRKSVETQHAPVQLIDDTLEKIHGMAPQQQRNKPIFGGVKQVVAAAVVLALLTGIVTTQVVQTNRKIEFAVLESVETDANRNFGTINVKRKIQELILGNGSSVILEVYENPSFPIEDYQNVKVTKISGKNVYFSEDEAYYYACYVESEQSIIIKSERLEKDTFVDAVKKYLKN